VRRLDRLISDISNASRLDAELARQDMQRLDLEKLVEAMVSIQKDVAAERGVGVVLDKRAGPHAPNMVGHDSRLAQVFSNLIDNAVSFSPKGATVHVGIRTADDAITVTVTDEGPGIRGDITRIFQRFYTDRPDGEHFGDHSGLGLAISKQIVEAHKGTIRRRESHRPFRRDLHRRLPRAPQQADRRQVSDRENVHATGIVLEGHGVMLRGPSGAGKSLLALSLLDQWEARGLAAALVADDRLDLERPVPASSCTRRPIAGLPNCAAAASSAATMSAEAPVHLVVDLVDRLERMVEEHELLTEVMGVALPRCPVPRSGLAELGHQMLLVSEALRALPVQPLTARQKTT
jgi:hypothetical protein